MLRIGHGYDVHPLVENRKLILGGVDVPYAKGLLGHSDADVLTHVIMDALLGAAALGSIGHHFPDTDLLYKGASSLDLLKHVKNLLADKAYLIQNIDSVITAQEPKLNPYIPLMRDTLSRILEVDIYQISIKATTTEHLGFEGRKEGISAHAVVLISKKSYV